jgi:hypothetical protein
MDSRFTGVLTRDLKKLFGTGTGSDAGTGCTLSTFYTLYTGGLGKTATRKTPYAIIHNP